ncbi:hypothetical protein OOJ91_33550 [Micromonospora lupini]|uniref:hypothetical protein n=1 Tax=Micromonospora lupini TaxID=285679 RepID=UPI00224E9787|nr:hypothetical protein [Micromonospora lupini]MCX5070772.1 hypothetical protein [Micromonospora lupini]
MEMELVLRALAGPLVVGIVLGSVILWSNLREKRRDPGTVFAVVDERTYKQALARIRRLEDRADTHEDIESIWRDHVKVQGLLIAIRQWLKREIKIGARRKALDRARRLEQIELQLEQLHVRMFGHSSGLEAS